MRLRPPVALAALAALTAGVAVGQAQEPPTPPPAARAATQIGYPSVDAALKDLRARGVPESKAGDWIQFTDRANRTLWSFSPPGAPAYPAAVRRQVVEEDGTAVIRMSVACEAEPSACDGLVDDFRKMTSERAARAGAPPAR